LCDAVIAPSESIAQLIRQRGVTAPIEIIPTGIDVQAFGSGRGAEFRRTHRLPENVFVVGHVGRLAPEKNLSYLARAVCAFLKQTRRARFLVVGDGSSAQEFRELFEQEGLIDRLVMLGVQTGQDLYDAYAAMDVFAFASLTETQGMVVAEAMAAGLPVVALDASGVREVVHDGENGLLLDANAPEEEFAARLDRIKTVPQLRERLRAGARRTARQFSRAESAKRALALYRKVLLQTRRERRQTEEDDFKALLKRIEVEWALVSEKAGAVLKALTGGEPSGKARD
jgi:glycosyltransferase involved in cell wall biosynthesis